MTKPLTTTQFLAVRRADILMELVRLGRRMIEDRQRYEALQRELGWVEDDQRAERAKSGEAIVPLHLVPA